MKKIPKFIFHWKLSHAIHFYGMTQHFNVSKVIIAHCKQLPTHITEVNQSVMYIREFQKPIHHRVHTVL